MPEYEHNTIVKADLEKTFSWFENNGSFRRLMPPWEVSEEVRADDSLTDGSQRVFRFPFGPIKMTWVAEHSDYNPPNSFSDRMIKGPFDHGSTITSLHIKMEKQLFEIMSHTKHHLELWETLLIQFLVDN